MKGLFICTSAFLLLTACVEKKQEVKESKVSQTIPVKIASIDVSDRQNQIMTSGLISTENEARLSFKIGGVIQNIPVKEGQKVQKGQLLAVLNNTEIGAQVQQAELALEKAQRDYTRASNLYKDSVVTLEQLQNSKTGLDIAKQNLQQVVFNKQYASIYSPADGFIVKKLLNTGEIAGPGSPVLIMSQVGGMNRWVLRAGVADRDWALIEKGNKAIVTTDAFPGKQFIAFVNKKAMAADPASGSFEIELVLDMKGMQPALGMFGKATIQPTVMSKGYSIPYEALLEANGNKGYVFVTNDRKTVQRKEVTIASIENNRILIADGLNGCSFVVIAGSPYLTDGASIHITQ
jgi:RND family efflux transporter MFP subunit